MKKTQAVTTTRILEDAKDIFGVHWQQFLFLEKFSNSYFYFTFTRLRHNEVGECVRCYETHAVMTPTLNSLPMNIWRDEMNQFKNKLIELGHIN